MENQVPQPKPSKELSIKSTPSHNAITWSQDDRKKLAVVIGRVFDLQKQYGKNAGQLQNIVDGFLWVLSEYPVQKVIQAFGQYIRTKTDMPTPCEIVRIIDPQPLEWVPDKSLYITLKEILKKDGPFGLDTDEIEYIKKYELHMLKAGR